jgi:hypothetical protein
MSDILLSNEKLTTTISSSLQSKKEICPHVLQSKKISDKDQKSD